MPEFIAYKNRNTNSLRWITITILFLAIGVILRMVSPSLGGVSLNWNIVMYCLAIMLCRPTAKEGFGIGIVSGLVATMTSKAALPYANMISDPVAAFFCAFIAQKNWFSIKIKNVDIEPLLLVFITTFISGGLFVTITKVVLSIPDKVYIYVMMPAVILVAFFGMTAGQLLYWPTKRIFNKEKEGDIDFRLKNFDLDIPKGSLTVVTGVNTSGKTTLLLAIAGARINYFEGFENSTIKINDIDIINANSDFLNENIGMVMADYEAQLVTETVKDEIAFSLENLGIESEKIKERTKEVLKMVNLENMEKRKISSLSGGQKQRLAIASILAIDPNIIVLDEPVAAIDPEGAIEIYDLLKTINEKYNKTIIVAEHDLKYVDTISNKFIVIDNGEQKFFGSIKDGLLFMYKNNVYAEAIPLKWKIRMEIGEKIC